MILVLIWSAKGEGRRVGRDQTVGDDGKYITRGQFYGATGDPRMSISNRSRGLGSTAREMHPMRCDEGYQRSMAIALAVLNCFRSAFILLRCRPIFA
jgi:hypothetical protein